VYRDRFVCILVTAYQARGDGCKMHYEGVLGIGTDGGLTISAP
jgi:hypothetical protein